MLSDGSFCTLPLRVGDALTLPQVGEFTNVAVVNECITATVVWGDEAEPLFTVPPLHDPSRLACRLRLPREL